MVVLRMEIHLRLSSEYPGSAAPAHGTSTVFVDLDGTRVAKLTVRPDDGRGRWYRAEVTQIALLRKLRRGAHRLRLVVEEGAGGNGVSVYGREALLNREPVEAPGPIRLVARYPKR